MSGDRSADSTEARVGSSWRSWSESTKAFAFVCAWFLPALALRGLHDLLPSSFSRDYVALGGLLIAAMVMLLLRVGGRVVVGRDGLEHHWLSKRVTYPWREVRELRERPDAGGGGPMLELVMEAGGIARIPLVDDGETASRLVALARERLEACRARVPSEPLPVLDRGGRDARAWVRHLRAVAGGSASHAREGYVATEALLRVAEDPDQPSLARASAVVAAASQLSPDEVERVRVMASTERDDSLRTVMEGALDPAAEDEALAEALDALERHAKPDA
ncbi:MAG: hypothetical protein JNK04_09830 [Myxococcales bacterium]|nr:hypothetical protein [Myxococcales bacterium]